MKNPLNEGKTLFLLLALGVPVICSAAAPQARTARQQIYNQAVTSAGMDISRIAALKNWQGYYSKINVFIPSEASGFTRCARPLRVAQPFREQLELWRLRYDIRCEGAKGWEINVTVKPDVYLPILVAKNTLERGRRLAASDVEIKKKNITGMRDGVMVSPDEAVGLTVKKRIRALQPLSPSLLEQPVLVERNQRVVMLAEQDGVQAQAIGEAQKKGRRGEVIKVKNLSSGLTVSAVVDGPGVVQMLLAPEQ